MVSYNGAEEVAYGVDRFAGLEVSIRRADEFPVDGFHAAAAAAARNAVAGIQFQRWRKEERSKQASKRRAQLPIAQFHGRRSAAARWQTLISQSLKF